MSGERLMPGDTGVETGQHSEESTSEASRYKRELGLDDKPTAEEIQYIKQFRRQRGLQDALERESLEKARERERENARSGISRKERENALAERAGLPAEPEEGYKYEWIHSQQLGEIPVKWHKEREKAEKDIKKLLGRIEIAKSSITEQMQVDIAQAKAVLEVLEVREKDEQENGEAFTPQQLKEQQDWAKKMRLEIRVRIDLHQAFFGYENGKSVEDVAKAMGQIPSAWLDVIFGLEEKIPGKEERFNPFVEALQYYEDHGHEFARHNIAKDRERFGAKVQKYLVDFVARKSLGIDPKTSLKDLSEENKTKYNEFITAQAKEYAWAQNMAERLFRATGRAIMYDYLVVNKGEKDEKMVDINYKVQAGEKIDWAGGRDGCDYPMSKILRFRENLATSSEGNLMRPHLELMDGVDIYGGDFWKTIRDKNINKPAGAGLLWTYRVRKEDLETDIFKEKFNEKVKKLIEEKPGLTKEEAEGKVWKMYRVIDNPNSTDPRTNQYYEADIYTDREAADNEGEMVGRVDFRQMARKKNENGTVEGGVDFKGVEFEENMGDSPWGIWIVRRLGGPEEAKKGLTGDAASFLLNPNFESLGKLISTFDYSKDNAWKVKEQLLKNFIKYARSEEILGTGKAKYSEDEILAGINQLTGLTDKNGAQFVQMPERRTILADYFNIKILPEEQVKIEQEARAQAEREVREESKGLNKSEEQIELEIKKRTDEKINKMTNIMLNSRIEHGINTRLAASFAGNFAAGAATAGLKQALAELGVK